MADNKRAARKTAASSKTGLYQKSSLGAKARAAASKLKGKGSGKHAKMDYTAARKNTESFFNAPSLGKHSKEAAARKAATAPASKPQAQGLGSAKEAIDVKRVYRNQGQVPGKVLNMNEAMATRRKSRRTQGSMMSAQEGIAVRRLRQNRDKAAA